MGGMKTAIAPRILIVDDYPALRDRVRELLRAALPNATLLEAPNAETALDMIAAGPPPDVVLMDIRLPGMNGLAATRKVMALAPATRVIMLTLYNGAQHQRQAVDAGAVGYVLKHDAATALVPTIERVCGEESP